MGSKEKTSMFQQGRGMNWTVKKTTLIISKIEKNNLLKTILFCQHIKSSLNKKDKKQRKHIIIIPVLSYTHVLKHLWWSLIYIRFYNFQTIILTYYYYYTKKENYLHHRNYEILKNNWSPITTTNIRTYHKFISINFCQKSFIYK